MAIKVANNQSLTAITALPSAVSGGAMNLLETQTASSSSTISFTSNIDSTYDEYVFKFYDIHPETDGAYLTFQADTGTNSDYNETITSTFFYAQHDEASSGPALAYATTRDLAQSTNFQPISLSINNDNDSNYNGTLQIFSPSSSVYVKHFISVSNELGNGDLSYGSYAAGYFNTTSAIDAIQFKMASGNIDAGTFKLYGVS